MWSLFTEELEPYFSLEIRAGRTSQSELIASVHGEEDFNPGVYAAHTSDTAIYVRLKLPYTVKGGTHVDKYNLKAVYGMMRVHNVDSGSSG